MKPGTTATVALLPWGDLFEDFLDTIGVSLDTFCDEMSGGWLFGYAEALQTAGVRPVIVIVSGRVTRVERRTHRPTGATICILPASRAYRTLRSALDRSRAQDGRRGSDSSAGARSGRSHPRIARFLARTAPMFNTPVPALVRELAQDGCSAILCQEYDYARFDLCVLAGRLARIPVYATFQGGLEELSGAGRFVRRLALASAAGVIIGPEREARRVRERYQVPAHKLGRVFNPLDTRSWRAMPKLEARRSLGIDPDTRVVVWHGRISVYHKGLDVLLEAWERASIMMAGAPVLLLLLGAGPDADEFRRRLADCAAPVRWEAEHVHDRDEMRRYLSAGDAYAFTSRHEGFAVAPLEAMACGLPVVTTDVSGAREIFRDGEASGGIIVPQQDAAAVAEALVRLLRDSALAGELGTRARRRVEEGFSLEAVGHALAGFMGLA